MGDAEGTRVKELMDELRAAAEQDGYEVFIYAEKKGKYRYAIDMDLPGMGVLFGIVQKYYDKLKMMDLMKN